MQEIPYFMSRQTKDLIEFHWIPFVGNIRHRSLFIAFIHNIKSLNHVHSDSLLCNDEFEYTILGAGEQFTRISC
jgi:hypothetical protein